MSGEAAKQYNPSEVGVDFGGKSMSGFAEGSFITVTEDEDRVGVVKGIDGSVVFSRVEAGYFVVKLSVLQTSDFNDVLDSHAEANRLGPGLSFVKFSVRDQNGRALHTTQTCIVKKVPESEYDQKAKARTWELYCTFGQNRVRGSRPIG
jgi:hypothetical protein